MSEELLKEVELSEEKTLGSEMGTFEESAGIQGAPERRNRNVFEEIMITGHDEDFVPAITPEFCPTDAPAGSSAKVEVLAERVRKGLPLWHPEDRCSYNGLIGLHNHFRD